MSMFGGLIRVLIILLIIRIVVSFFMSMRRSASARPSRPVPERLGGTLVRDPQCGTYVPEARAVAAGGLSFCSTTCRDAWMAAHSKASDPGLRA